MPRAIVHLTTFLQGGAGRAITQLACAQRAAGDDVLVVTSSTGVPGYENYIEYLDRLRDAGITLVEEDSLFKRDPALNERVFSRLRRLREPESIDIMHAHAAVPATIALRFAAGASARRPAVVQTQHGWGTSKTPEQARHDLEVLNRVDRIIATSQATQTFLAAAGVAPERMAVIPCGVSREIPASPPEAIAAIERVRASACAVVVGCVGSVTENKNQGLLIQALVADEARNVHAVFIGEGGDVLETRAREAGVADRVHVLGYQSAADAWMGLFDVLAIPSRTEGQGLVVLEAFRAGVPVVASAIPPLRELVVDDDTGWLFESEDAHSLATAIARASTGPREIRERVVTEARRRFLSGYTLDVMVARHDALYDQTGSRD